MNETRKCPGCGTEIPATLTAGLCPRCLLKAGMESGTQSVQSVTQTPLKPSDSKTFVPPELADLSEKFPQLEFLELLGRGGMGAVYKARQKGLDRLVAVKILPPEVGSDPAFAERFTREARALARLNHPNIVGVYDFGQAGGLYYFIMEFIDGVNLRQALRAGTLGSKETLKIVPQICDALQFAHDEGIVHRDIKPENILLDTKGRVKIADFGLAKLLGHDSEKENLTGTHQVMGTLRYMAPEQITGTKQVDHRADIFSLGVVFYELLTGELPLGRFAPPSQKVQIDVRLDEVVLRTLEQEPSKRYQQVSELKTNMESIYGVMPAALQNALGREYRSKAEIFGIPLVHIAMGINPQTGKRRIARGIFAMGDMAIGVIASGGIAIGGITFGGLGFGLISCSGLALGILAAIGGVAIGGFAWGGLSVGIVALGGMTVGYYAFGGQAFGAYVMCQARQDPEAVRFFTPWAYEWVRGMIWLAVLVPLMVFAQMAISFLAFRSKPKANDGRAVSQQP